MGTENGRGSAGSGVRPIFWVLLAFVVIVGAATAALAYFRHRAQTRAGEVERAGQGRAERVREVAAIALAPLPLVSPLVERPGKDAYGYPRSYVDRAALRSLLLHGKLTELTHYAEEYQRAFEADFHAEYYVRALADAFESAEPDLAPALDAWVQATPQSFAPYLARGSHRLDAGYAARGGAFAKETDATNFAAMRQQFALARADFQRALELSPRLVVAFRQLIRISFIGSSRADVDTYAHQAFAVCPACMQPRAAQQYALTPRWGGSYRAMKAAADAAPVAENPLLRLLPGYAELDRAELFARDKQLERALEHVGRALALGETLDFLLEKADILRRMSNPAGATAALHRAQEFSPSNPRVSFALAQAEVDAKEWRAAYRDLVAGLRIEPTSTTGRFLKPYVVRGLIFIGWQAHEQGRDGEALDVLDEAAELEVSPEVDGRRAAVLTSAFHGSDAELKTLEDAVLAAPHDFAAHAKLDYALSTRRDWVRIEAMWTRYIADHPGEARAYRERSGTFFQLRRMPEAHADAERACDLGSSAGCSLARRL
jgi:tetratricopeptide (TPR) repeat protein